MKKAVIACLILLSALAAVVVSYGLYLNAPPYVGPVTERFDGERFRNPVPVTLPSPARGIRYFFTSSPGAWEPWRENPPADPVLDRTQQLRITYINHATLLIQLDSINILTDPIYSARPSPLSWVGPVRRHAPGLPLNKLPPIDVVLLSHNHYDHTDLPTLDSVNVNHAPRYIAGLGCGGLLETIGIHQTTELDWGQTTQAGSLTIKGEPCRHFSGRGWSDRQKTLWMSYTITGPSANIYFAGDTGYGPQFEDARAENPAYDLAILPIGSYNPRWFMQSLHLDPPEAVKAHLELGARQSLGIHFGTFRLSEEGQDTPVQALRLALNTAHIDTNTFRTLAPGQAWDIPQETP